MTVLWFSGVRFNANYNIASGSWVVAMAQALHSNCPDLVLLNVCSDDVKDVIREDFEIIHQVVFPVTYTKLINSKERISCLRKIFSEFQPDLVHIWGVEWDWCQLDFDKIGFPYSRVLLEIQGVMTTVAENTYGGLNIKQLLSCISLKEIIKPTSSLFFIRKTFLEKSKRESFVIKKFTHIATPSTWASAYIREIHPVANFYKSGIALRSAFYKEKRRWTNNNTSEPIIFTTANPTVPLKGLHVLIDAFVVIKKYYPNVSLHIAGDPRSGIRMSGYTKGLIRKLKECGLLTSTLILGNLDVPNLIDEYLNSTIFVNPSAVESYSLVNAEAMYLGIPVVSSFSGAMPELGIDGVDISYFPKFDSVQCAQKILELLKSPSKMLKLSENAMELANIRNAPESVASKQMNIYMDIISNNQLDR